jgi:quercetin dioxygenase-like cupin family protein
MRQQVSAFISIWALSVGVLAAAESDLSVSPVMKGSSTISGQQIEYPHSNKPEITAVVIQIQPGKESGRHMHPVPTYVHILQGSLTIEFEDGSRQVFKEGQGFLEGTNSWHNGKNLGDAPVKALVVFVGEEGSSNMVRPDEHHAAKH